MRRQDPRPRIKRGPDSSYGTRPYAHLREEFETLLQAQLQAGGFPDRRDAQIQRLKAEIDSLRERLTHRDQTIADLSAFKTQALSRLAAQHEEIQRLRRQDDHSNRVRRLVSRSPSTGPCS